MLRDPELAADLTQDAFVKAYKNYDTLEKPENARAWLYQIAHRVALDEIRRRQDRPVLPVDRRVARRGPVRRAPRAWSAGSPGEMQRALARIPERQRAALLLAELHDLTGLELAAALGVSHVAARALLTRARESLRQALADERARAPDPSRPNTGQRAPREPPRSAVAAPPDALVLAARPRPCPARRADDRAARARGVGLARRAPRRAARPAARSMPRTRADRMSLRAMRVVPPPRDLWARTSAALDVEQGLAGGGRRARPTRRVRARRCCRSRAGAGRPVGAFGSIAALMVVGFLIGTALIGPTGGKAPVPSHGVALGASATPNLVPTRIPVAQSDVSWVSTDSDGSIVLRQAPIDGVCPPDQTTGCTHIGAGASNVATLSVKPKSVHQSPTSGQMVVFGQGAGGVRRDDVRGQHGQGRAAHAGRDPDARRDRDTDRRDHRARVERHHCVADHRWSIAERHARLARADGDRRRDPGADVHRVHRAERHAPAVRGRGHRGRLRPGRAQCRDRGLLARWRLVRVHGPQARRSGRIRHLPVACR